MVFFVVLVVAFFLFLAFWYIIIPAIVLFVIWLWWTNKPQISCPACNKKYRRKGGYNKHLETCSAYQNYINENRRREEQCKEEERRQQEQRRQQEDHQRKQEEKLEGLKQDWRKNWNKKARWNFTEEEFWEIHNDIDKRKDDATRDLDDAKEKATEKLWDKFWATESESLQDKIQEKIDEIDDEFDEKIDEIEEEFEAEEEVLWDQVGGYDWYEPSEEEKRAKENYEKAKQDYKKSTGREWHDDDWERNWKEAFEDILGKSVNLDACYEILGLPNNTEFSQVKKRYRELALKHHPDKCQNKEEAEKKFKEIAAAYEAIKENHMGAEA